MSSWWLLLTLPLGLTTWAAFAVAGRQAGRRDLLWWAAGYAAALAAGLALMGVGAQTSSGMILAVVWVGGAIHALVARLRMRSPPTG